MKTKRRYSKSDNAVYYTVKYSKVLHRDNGPAIIQEDFSMWIRYGNLHRVDGPAVIYKNGDEEWWFYGKRHREDGPSSMCSTGEYWYLNNLRHRSDGPAVELKNGIKLWYLNGHLYEDKEAWFEALTEDEKAKAIYSKCFIGG